uniref:ribosomal protein S13 n=1 Tax=Dictyostelium intermedium TaxID=361076 RepID=UPI001D1000C7|nr:ribosomal protein S13 [Dictyostelium intermedium]DAZ85369.1 TPA_asm: ribosomal protein S13 [Dictyostelium intermedium]
MGIVIGKIELESKKQVVCELRKKIKGINLNTAKRIIMLSGNLERLTGKNLLKSQEKQIVEIIQTFKGLYEYTFGLKEEEFEKIRRIENAYKYIRVRKGYPVRGRTKSNANTAGKKVKKENSKLAKNVDVLKKKPTNRKERKLYNKIKKLQEKHNKQQKKIQDGKKKNSR